MLCLVYHVVSLPAGDGRQEERERSKLQVTAGFRLWPPPAPQLLSESEGLSGERERKRLREWSSCQAKLRTCHLR